MKQRLTAALVKRLPLPPTGSRIYYDVVPGFGLRVTANGSRSYILNYRAGGRERRMTIGSASVWTVHAAREEAKEVRRMIDAGHDPLVEDRAARDAPTVSELCDRFEAEHLPRLRRASQEDYSSTLKTYVRPALGGLKVAEVTFADIDRLHRKFAKAIPVRSNKTITILSKMFTLAIKWEMRSDNPCKGVERCPEVKRERYLTTDELARLADALAAREGRSANAIRLLLLTGCRKSELLTAKWAQFDLAAGIWTKPASSTKQGKAHRIPLSAPALDILAEMRAKAGPSEFLFPGTTGKPHQNLYRYWAAVRKDAQLADCRIHDLRHSFASVLVCSGLSLPIIGKLLGHTQPATTARYSHLQDEPLRSAVERAGAVISGASAKKC